MGLKERTLSFHLHHELGGPWTRGRGGDEGLEGSDQKEDKEAGIVFMVILKPLKI